MYENYFFQGWTEENLVNDIEEWGPKGRIIWVNKMDIKPHVTRILEILEIINNDLGFANIELQESSIVSSSLFYNFKNLIKSCKTFVTKVYLAISRKLVVGVCVAEPLKEAHSMYTKNNSEYIDLKKVTTVK